MPRVTVPFVYIKPGQLGPELLAPTLLHYFIPMRVNDSLETGGA